MGGSFHFAKCDSLPEGIPYVSERISGMNWMYHSHENRHVTLAQHPMAASACQAAASGRCPLGRMVRGSNGKIHADSAMDLGIKIGDFRGILRQSHIYIYTYIYIHIYIYIYITYIYI